MNKLNLIAIPEEAIVDIMTETVADIVCVVDLEVSEFKVVWNWTDV